jgi:hypothetical protein
MTNNPYLRAIDIIKERGWWQGGWQGPNGEVCIAESLRLAGASPSNFGPTLRLAMNAAVPLSTLPGVQTGAGDWNDAPERTVEDVYFALKLAAADWDAEHDGGVEVRETSA